MSTLCLPVVLPTPKEDAMQLDHAFKGMGSDTKAIINILAHRNAMQRIYIKQEYRTLYSEDLENRLSTVLGGDIKKAMVLWMHDPTTCDATIVRKTLNGDAAGVKAATEVICSRTPSQISLFKQAYYATFGKYLEHEIEYQASGDHKRLLLAYVTIGRYEGPEVDKVVVESDAKNLFHAGEKKLGTDDKIFIRIFSERSKAHLAAVEHAYHTLYGKSLEKAIKKETAGLFQYTLLSILRCAINPAIFFAKVLHKAMKGVRTDDAALTRLFVTRTEIDMNFIKLEFHKKYGKSLHDAVRAETSGHFKSFLLALLGSSY